MKKTILNAFFLLYLLFSFGLGLVYLTLIIYGGVSYVEKFGSEHTSFLFLYLPLLLIPGALVLLSVLVIYFHQKEKKILWNLLVPQAIIFLFLFFKGFLIS